MGIFDSIIMPLLSLLGGLSLFLFGMKAMGNGLERSAGRQMKSILARLTSNKFMAFLLGLGVTAVIQSSGATTVMVVGFVNSGIMSLHQATGVIFGANLGTAATSWLLSTSSISGGDNGLWALNLFKPDTFGPILALVGIYLYMFQKKTRRRNYGLVLLGFYTLLRGMSFMSEAMRPMMETESAQNALVAVSNPIVGFLIGLFFTAVIQSSSASVGILQALSLTGAVTFGITFPFLNGANIGACICAIISAIGASRDARRSAMINVYFNVLSALLCMGVFYGLDFFIGFDFLDRAVNPLEIAMLHTGIKVICLAVFLPGSRLVEYLADITVRGGKEKEKQPLLDDRFLATPAVAIERARKVALDMADISVRSLRNSLSLLDHFDDKTAEQVFADEDEVDKYEDALGTYLVKISACTLTVQDSHETAKLLHIIGDYERISDHAVNIAQTAQEMADKKLEFSAQAKAELSVMMNAINEILDTVQTAFCKNDTNAAFNVEPLEEVIDTLNSRLKKRHVERLQRGECTIELGFVLSDLLTNLERVSDHCSNIAGCVIEIEHDALDVHEYLEKLKTEGNARYIAQYNAFKDKYVLPPKSTAGAV